MYLKLFILREIKSLKHVGPAVKQQSRYNVLGALRWVLLSLSHQTIEGSQRRDTGAKGQGLESSFSCDKPRAKKIAVAM